MRRLTSIRMLFPLLTLALLMLPAVAVAADGSAPAAATGQEEEAAVTTPEVDFTAPNLGLPAFSAQSDPPPGCGYCGPDDWDQDCSCYSEYYCDGGPTFCEYSGICNCLYL